MLHRIRLDCFLLSRFDESGFEQTSIVYLFLSGNILTILAVERGSTHCQFFRQNFYSMDSCHCVADAKKLLSRNTFGIVCDEFNSTFGEL